MSWRFIKEKAVRTRKPHECRICGEEINKRKIAVARTGVSDDRILTFHMHPECDRLSSDWNQDDWETTSPGEVRRPVQMMFKF